MTAAIKNLSEADLSWEDVSNSLIEESKSLKIGVIRDRPATVSCVCPLCSKPGH